MKKIYTVLAALGVTASMAAQQLPNAGFEGEWTDCVPWTSNGNTKTKGVTPSPWTISNVIGISGTGATQVGFQVEGCESANAVQLKNTANQYMPSQIVPGYITLGTPWSTSVMGKQNDGGVFGGIEFTYRPDALSFDSKRTGVENAKSSVVAYSWKGTYTQKSVPANIVILGNPKSVDMIDRDRNILGKETVKGGEVSHSDDAKLIAYIDQYVYETAADEDDNDEWETFEVEFMYESDENPEKINVILSPGEYFNSTVTNDLTLTIDNVKLVYYSRLSGIKFKGVDIEGFDSEYFDYELDEIMPTDEKDIEVATMGNSGVAKAEVALDPQKNVATITVSNDHGTDADNLAKHVYTVKFLPAGSSIADTAADAANNVRYYNLQGNIVDADALVSGQTYIKVANGVATKIIK